MHVVRIPTTQILNTNPSKSFEYCRYLEAIITETVMNIELFPILRCKQAY